MMRHRLPIDPTENLLQLAIIPDTARLHEILYEANVLHVKIKYYPLCGE